MPGRASPGGSRVSLLPACRSSDPTPGTISQMLQLLRTTPLSISLRFPRRCFCCWFRSGLRGCSLCFPSAPRKPVARCSQRECNRGQSRLCYGPSPHPPTPPPLPRPAPKQRLLPLRLSQADGVRRRRERRLLSSCRRREGASRGSCLGLENDEGSDPYLNPLLSLSRSLSPEWSPRDKPEPADQSPPRPRGRQTR